MRRKRRDRARNRSASRQHPASAARLLHKGFHLANVGAHAANLSAQVFNVRFKPPNGPIVLLRAHVSIPKKS
jgi:hypothetical protein